MGGPARGGGHRAGARAADPRCIARVLEETRDEDGFLHVSTELVGLDGGSYWESLGGYWRRTAIKHLFPEVIAVEDEMLVDLSRGTESERRQPPLRQLYRVVQRVKCALEKGYGGSREADASDASASNASHVRTGCIPRYARGVATTLIEGCIEAAAAECRDSDDPRVADYCRRMHDDAGASKWHPMGCVWDEMVAWR